MVWYSGTMTQQERWGPADAPGWDVPACPGPEVGCEEGVRGEGAPGLLAAGTTLGSVSGGEDCWPVCKADPAGLVGSLVTGGYSST